MTEHPRETSGSQSLISLTAHDLLKHRSIRTTVSDCNYNFHHRYFSYHIPIIYLKIEINRKLKFLAATLQVYHRDVCELGFKDELNGCADAVFLDLPAPQIAVPHALKALKDSGKYFTQFM